MIEFYILKISTDVSTNDSILKKLESKLNDGLLREKANALERFFLSSALLVMSLLSIVIVVMIHLIACGKVVKDEKSKEVES